MSKRPINVEVRLEEVRGDQVRLIKRFVKKTKKSGILDEYKERMFFEKKSDKKRRKKKLSKRKVRRLEEEKRKKLDIYK